MGRKFLRNVLIKAFGRLGANKVDEAIDKRLAAGESYGSIWIMLLPFIMQIVATLWSGGTLDWATLLQQILNILIIPLGDEPMPPPV